MLLRLGVIDVPYANPPPALRRNRSRVARGTQTTGDVAEWLETRYHVMEIFAQQHLQDIATDLEEGLKGALESLLAGAPPSLNAFGGACARIEERFRDFLSNREMESLGYPGVPTQAALRGVSHRFKRPYKRRPPRPSFIDTGLYQASETVWVE